jgi:hypothetical protein
MRRGLASPGLRIETRGTRHPAEAFQGGMCMGVLDWPALSLILYRGRQCEVENGTAAFVSGCPQAASMGLDD